jgi:hypothetical protein
VNTTTITRNVFQDEGICSMISFYNKYPRSMNKFLRPGIHSG